MSSIVKLNHLAVPSFIDSNNSTTTILNDTEEFTGIFTNVSSFCEMTVIIACSHGGQLDMRLSTNGTDIDRTKSIDYTSSGSVHTLVIVSSHMAIHILNNSGSTYDYLRVQTIFHRFKNKNLTYTMNQTINNNDDCELVRAVITGSNEAGNFNNIKTDINNALKVSITNPLNPFGSLSVENDEPLVQIDALYGILNSDVETFISGTGTVSTNNSKFSCATGTTANSYGVIRSRRLAKYLAGQGLKSRFTSKYTTGIENSLQIAGLFSSTVGLFIGYNGINFGICHRYGGRLEIQKITITGGASGNGNINFTLNGISNIIAITSGAIIHNAYEIESSNIWATSASGVECYQIGNDIYWFFLDDGNKTLTMSYIDTDATGMTVSAFTEVTQGVSNIEDWTYQNNFNIDNLDGTGSSNNPTSDLLDPTKLNLWSISLEYLGAGTIIFSRNNSIGSITQIHKLYWSNINEEANLYPNPNCPIGYSSASLGSTSNLVVEGASMYASVSGKFSFPRNPISFSNSNTGISTSEESIIILKCGAFFNGETNQREIILVQISIATISFSKPVLLCIRLDPIINGETNYQFINENESCMYADTQTGIFTSGGSLLFSEILSKEDSSLINLETLHIKMERKDTLSISASTSATSGEVISSISFFEV